MGAARPSIRTGRLGACDSLRTSKPSSSCRTCLPVPGYIVYDSRRYASLIASSLATQGNFLSVCSSLCLLVSVGPHDAVIKTVAGEMKQERVQLRRVESVAIGVTTRRSRRGQG